MGRGGGGRGGRGGRGGGRGGGGGGGGGGVACQKEGARGRRGPVEVKGLGNKKMVGRDKKLLSRVKRAYQGPIKENEFARV